MGDRRIDISLFDTDLKNLISASAKIFPMVYADIVLNTNPYNYEYARCTDTEHKNEIYIWDGVWKLIGADDINVTFDEVKGKPNTYPPSPHTHDYALNTHNHDSSYASKSVETTVTDHESRLDYIEGGYSNGHAHTNLSILDSITQALVDAWNSAVAHISDVVAHITSDERTLWNSITSKADKTYVDTQLASKAESTTLNGHTGNSTIHVTQNDKDAWNGKSNITQGTVQPSAGFWFKEV